MTHVIPLINKTFYSLYAKSNYLWKSALVRLSKGKPELWVHGLKCFLINNPLPPPSSDFTSIIVKSTDEYIMKGNNQSGSFGSKDIKEEEKDENDKNERLIRDAGRSMEYILSHRDGYFFNDDKNIPKPIYMELYCDILMHYIKYTSPLFYMPGIVQIGIPIRIFFFEPRYRLLITELMSKFPDEYSRGIEIVDDKTRSHRLYDMKNGGYTVPTFLYANKPLRRGNSASVVQVRYCTIYPDKTANVVLMPISTVRIEQVWERLESNHLYEARVMKMGEDEEQKEMNEQSKMRVRTAFMERLGP